jgi:hypothetical protein
MGRKRAQRRHGKAVARREIPEVKPADRESARECVVSASTVADERQKFMEELYNGQNAHSTTRTYIHPKSGQPTSTGAAIDREFRLDQILLALWHGRLTADAAAERIVAELGMSHFQARDEVDGFLRD